MIKVPTKLNMLQDVHLPSPADTDVVYWDDITKSWKSMTVKEMVVGDPAWRYVFIPDGECLWFEDTTHELQCRVSAIDEGSGRNISQGFKVIDGILYINV